MTQAATISIADELPLGAAVLPRGVLARLSAGRSTVVRSALNSCWHWPPHSNSFTTELYQDGPGTCAVPTANLRVPPITPAIHPLPHAAPCHWQRTGPTQRSRHEPGEDKPPRPQLQPERAKRARRRATGQGPPHRRRRRGRPHARSLRLAQSTRLRLMDAPPVQYARTDDGVSIA